MTISKDKIAEAIHYCFVSPNVVDSNLESANLVDVVDRSARNLYRIANAITDQTANPAYEDGKRVGCLTEAILALSDNVGRIADAIHELAAK